MFHEIEGVLLRGAAEVQRGQTPDPERIVHALRRVSPEHRGLAPVIAALLEANSRDIQVFSACALANVKDAAIHHIPALIALAEKKIPYGPSAAAISTLGALATPDAIAFLGQALESHPRNELPDVVGALKFAGAAAVPAIGPLKRLLADSTIPPIRHREIRDAVAAIHTAARYEYASTMASLDLHEYIPIAPNLGKGGSTAYEYFARYSTPVDPTHEGLIHRGRFRFLMNGALNQRNEIGIRVYGRPEGGNVVVFDWDDRSHGVTPTNGAEAIATAALHIFNLDPRRTTWIENYQEKSGLSEGICQEVTFEFDARAGAFEHPEWRRAKSCTALLRELGIEA